MTAAEIAIVLLASGAAFLLVASGVLLLAVAAAFWRTCFPRED